MFTSQAAASLRQAKTLKRANCAQLTILKEFRRLAWAERYVMTSIERQTRAKILLVDDDAIVLEMMTTSLELDGFEVVAVGGVTDALKCIATECFQVLITDLHMPNAGDGFSVISAMRHTQSVALTMLLSAFPDVESAMRTIILEADEILVKPVHNKQLCGTRPRKTNGSKTRESD